MATGVQVLTSNDASAPQLYGSAGSLTTVLDACFVNGYGSKSPIGTGGAGAWSITYTATNKRVYRPSAGNRYYVRINDAAAGTGGAQEALVKGAESFSDVDTATNPIPATGQSALTQNSLIIRKSATADAITGRPWVVVGDDRTVYMFISTGDSANTYTAWMWGDFYSLLSGDSYRTMIVSRTTENSGTMSADRLDKSDAVPTTAVPGHFIQRTYAGTGTSITTWKGLHFLVAPGGANAITLLTTVTGPNVAGGGYMTLPLLIGELAPTPRGLFRGLWFGGHTLASYNDGDTYSGTGDLAGKTFRVIKQSGSSSVYVVETSDTWLTSS